MKKTLKNAFFISAICLAVTSCAQPSSSSSTSYKNPVITYKVKTPSGTPKESYSDKVTLTTSYTPGEPLLVKMENLKDYLLINNTSSAAGKGVYLAKVNNTSADTYYEYTRTIVGTTGINEVVAADRAPNTANFDANPSTPFNYSNTIPNGCLTVKLAEKFKFPQSPDFNNSSLTKLQRDDAPHVWAVNDTKNIYLVNGNNERFSIGFKILAIDDTNKIIIWGRSGSDTTLSEKETTFESSSVAIDGKSWSQYYLEKFKDIYNLDKTVFGDEAELEGSDTYGYTNLVFFDMNNEAARYKQEGVRGYFFGVDYYPHDEVHPNTNGYYSNEGKYLYINVNAAVETNSNNGGNDTYQTITATMSHEFMHMIQFNQKYKLQGITCTTAFGEMMGEIAKDLLRDYLKPEDCCSPWDRLIFFNAYYYQIGMTGYTQSDSVYYATNYVFGSWLCRNFGGVKLAREFIQNAYNSDDAIVHAVNSLNGTSYTMDELMRMFVIAITADNPSYQYNLKKASLPQNEIVCPADKLSSNSDYNFPLRAFNLFNLEETCGTAYANSFSPNARIFLSGPVLAPADTNNIGVTKLMSDHGVILCKIGTIKDNVDFVKLDFSYVYTNTNTVQYYVIITEDR